MATGKIVILIVLLVLAIVGTVVGVLAVVVSRVRRKNEEHKQQLVAEFSGKGGADLRPRTSKLSGSQRRLLGGQSIRRDRTNAHGAGLRAWWGAH